MNKALVVSPETSSLQIGGFDPIVRALTDCGQRSVHCMLYAYGQDVVWGGPNAGQTARINNVPIFGKASKPGVPVTIQQFVSLSPECHALPLPEIDITQQPAHGSVAIEQNEDFPNFDANSPLATCNGLKTPMLRLRYTSTSGFNGVDFFSLNVTEASKPAKAWRYAVHVN